MNAILAVNEPQHEDNLCAVREHGQVWVVCRRCNRQWAIHGSTAEMVALGDDYCDESGDKS